MKIKVTQKHIDAGSRCNGFRCPIAMAVKEVVGHNDVNAWSDYILIAGRQHPTPGIAVRFMRAFDERYPVEPFAFEL